ncbi:MAG: hypothetical protein Q7O66_06085 [Dehalococcoidia bacterium]|nr:hypothetical protein [Dehalococcoidia bacterium]
MDNQNITEIESLLCSLPGDSQKIFNQIFQLSTTTGRLDPPEQMHQWIEKFFGSVEAVKEQKVVKTMNTVTFDGALFNELRAKRPIETKINSSLFDEIEKNIGDPLCNPLTGTPADVLGRITGQASVTASNIAKYDGFHGLVVFNQHNPLNFTKEMVIDYLDTAWQWALKAHRVDPAAKYYFFMWNCLWKSGGSLLHGHAQMTLSRDFHYARVEQWRRGAICYGDQFGANYFDDLYQVHRDLGLGFEHKGVRVMAYLTPIKEKETLLISSGLDANLKEAIFTALDCLYRRLGVTTFNVAIYLPPMAPASEDWRGFPTIVRIVDRGDPMNRTNDIGAMELYACSVISSDPFAVARVMRERFAEDS